MAAYVSPIDGQQSRSKCLHCGGEFASQAVDIHMLSWNHIAKVKGAELTEEEKGIFRRVVPRARGRAQATSNQAQKRKLA